MQIKMRRETISQWMISACTTSAMHRRAARESRGGMKAFSIGGVEAWVNPKGIVVSKPKEK
jgi:hypothetical protein